MGIDGRIQTRNYENQQGQRVYVTEVVVENFALLEPRQNGGMNQGGQQPFNNGNQQSFGNQAPFGGQGQYGGGNNQPQSTNNAPQSNSSANTGAAGFGAGQNSSANPFSSNNDDGDQSTEISDDDLPF